jgi:DNA repair protein RecO (recombination protein O)
MIQPLSLVELDVYQKPNTSINNIKDLRNSPVLFEIQDDIIKKTVAMFMTEIINYCLTEEVSDKELFDFLENQIIDLDQKKMPVLFPSLFLLDLSKYLGIYPQGKFSDGTPFFSYEDGIFVHESTIHTASEKSSQMISQMIHEEVMNPKLDALARKNLLESIVRYYQFHVIRNKKVKSIEILSEILN